MIFANVFFYVFGEMPTGVGCLHMVMVMLVRAPLPLLPLPLFMARPLLSLFVPPPSFVQHNGW